MEQQQSLRRWRQLHKRPCASKGDRCGNHLRYGSRRQQKEGICAITVTSAVSVSSITLSASSLTLNKGQTYSLSATVCPENATKRTIQWSSSDYSIACVSASGLVSAKNNGGTAIISATALDGSGVSASCTVTVKQTTTEEPEEEKPENKVDGSTVADPIDVYSGAHLIENTVMTLFGGQALKLTVRYDSTKLLSGSLGSGWYHNYEKHLEISGSEVRVYSSPSVYAKYDSEDGVTFTCAAANRNGYILQVDTTQTYPYILHCNSECTEYYNTDGKLAKIVDHQGFETLLAYTDSLIAVTDAVSGKKIYLEKNADGRISKIYDDAEREVTFTYSSGLLTGICDVNGNTLTYTYDDENRIQSGVDSKEICYFYNTYDACGRVISQRDGIAGSVPSVFVYESDGKRITTDRCGHQSVRIFDQNGLLVSHTDENGNTKTYAYDERFNVIKETDARGNSVVKVYNGFNKPTEITDKTGTRPTSPTMRPETSSKSVIRKQTAKFRRRPLLTTPETKSFSIPTFAAR